MDDYIKCVIQEIETRLKMCELAKTDMYPITTDAMKVILDLLKCQAELEDAHKALVDTADGMYIELKEARKAESSNYAAQLAMLGYEPDGSPKDLVEVARCKGCKWNSGTEIFPYCQILSKGRKPNWFCADGIAKDTNVLNKV